VRTRATSFCPCHAAAATASRWNISVATFRVNRRWWPNLECPTGHNVIAKHPSVLFTAGSRGQTPRYFVERLESLTANTGSWLNAHSRGNSHGGTYKASDNFSAQKISFLNSLMPHYISPFRRYLHNLPEPITASTPVLYPNAATVIECHR